MDQLIQELGQGSALDGGFEIWRALFALGFSFFLCLALGFFYRLTHRGLSYSVAYVHAMVIMGVTVSIIMLIIGSNIARAFSLVGALSIIRFRNAMKETRDVGFIFLVMAIGMAVGTRFFLLAIFATAALSAFILLMTRFNFFAKEVTERILRVRFPIDRDFETAFETPFRAHLDEYRVISLETVRAGVLQELVLSVVLKRTTTPTALLEAVRAFNDNNKVTLIIGQQSVDL